MPSIRPVPQSGAAPILPSETQPTRGIAPAPVASRMPVAAGAGRARIAGLDDYITLGVGLAGIGALGVATVGGESAALGVATLAKNAVTAAKAFGPKIAEDWKDERGGPQGRRGRRYVRRGANDCGRCGLGAQCGHRHGSFRRRRTRTAGRARPRAADRAKAGGAMQSAPITRCAATVRGPGVLLFLLTRLVRFTIAVPLTAFVLHFAQPDLPWWSWCGVAALTLLFLWCVDGITALVRRRMR